MTRFKDFSSKAKKQLYALGILIALTYCAVGYLEVRVLKQINNLTSNPVEIGIVVDGNSHGRVIKM